MLKKTFFYTGLCAGVLATMPVAATNTENYLTDAIPTTSTYTNTALAHLICKVLDDNPTLQATQTEIVAKQQQMPTKGCPSTRLYKKTRALNA